MAYSSVFISWLGLFIFNETQKVVSRSDEKNNNLPLKFIDISLHDTCRQRNSKWLFDLWIYFDKIYMQVVLFELKTRYKWLCHYNKSSMLAKINYTAMKTCLKLDFLIYSCVEIIDASRSEKIFILYILVSKIVCSYFNFLTWDA